MYIEHLSKYLFLDSPETLYLVSSWILKTCFKRLKENFHFLK